MGITAMRTRAVLAVLLVLALAVALTACGGSNSGSGSGSDASAQQDTSAGGSTASSDTGEPGKKLKIGLVAVNLNSPSITRIKDAFVAAAKKRGWSVDVFDGKGDQAATNNAANQYIQQGVDAIINNSSPNQQMTGVIKNAHAKGIKFISIYGGAGSGVDAEVGTNELINSANITQYLVDRIGGQGKVLKLNWTVLQALRDRDHAFDAVVADHKGIKVSKIEVKVPGQVEDAYNQTVNWLKSNKDVKAIWVGWDELAPPVVRALQQANLDKKVFVVGFDGNPFAWDLIRKGSPYVIEPANPFEPMGEKAVQVTADLVAGKPGPVGGTVYMRPCLITKDTVPAKGQFPDWKSCPFFTGDIQAKP